MSSDRRKTAPIGPRERARLMRLGTLDAGERLGGRYRVVDRLGAGGHGDVYRVRDEVGGGQRALKWLFDREAPKADGVEQRLSILGRLDHPGLVRTFDIGEHRGAPYVVHELVDGEPLDRRLGRSRPLTVVDAAAIVVPVLVALEHLHANGIVHGDVKPHNVMLTDEGPKLLDYGLARRAGVDPGRSMTLEATVEYVAPEVVGGAPRDHRSDLYAVGVLFYESIFGSAPYVGTTPAEVAEAHRFQPLRFPATAEDEHGVAVVAWLVRALNRNPAARFTTAAAMAEALRRAVDRPRHGRPSLWRARIEDRRAVEGRAGVDFGRQVLPWLFIVGVLAAALLRWWWVVVRSG